MNLPDLPIWMNPAARAWESEQRSPKVSGEQLMNIALMKQQLDTRKEAKLEAAKWQLESGGDPVWKINHNYMGTNSDAAQFIHNQQVAASQSLLAQKAKQDIVDFSKRLSALPPQSRAAIQGMSNDPKTGLPTATKWNALAVAEQTEQVRQENVRKQAEIDAMAQGLKPKVKIGPKGVETTFEQPKPDKDTSTFTPEEKELPSGTKIIHLSPNRWQVKPKSGSDIELTDEQLRMLAKEGEADYPTESKSIMDFLMAKAKAKIAPKEAVAAPAPSAAPNLKTDSGLKYSIVPSQ